MRPDQESNLQPFGVQDDTQTKPQRQGLYNILLSVTSLTYYSFECEFCFSRAVRHVDGQLNVRPDALFAESHWPLPCHSNTEYSCFTALPRRAHFLNAGDAEGDCLPAPIL